MNSSLKCVLLICFIQLCYTKPNEYKSYKNYKVYEIQGPKKDVAEFLMNIVETHDIPIYERKGSSAQILAAPELVPVLDSLTLAASLQRNIVVDDFSKLIETETRVFFREKKPFSWSAYFDIDDINDFLGNTSAAHPDSVELIEGGQSYEGRKILGLRINTPTGEDKPVMFVESGIHAREWITPATTTYFINELLTSSDPQVAAMRDQFDWRIFPAVNPDGYHYSFTWDRMWRKTRSESKNGCRGADPNRNWDYNWGNYGSSNDPCNYQTFAGSKPFSEIETRSLSQYISRIENLRGYIAFHADAQCLLLPYSDSSDHVDNYDDLHKIGNTSLQYGKAVNGETYDGPGTAAEILWTYTGGGQHHLSQNKFTTKLRSTTRMLSVGIMGTAPHDLKAIMAIITGRHVSSSGPLLAVEVEDKVSGGSMDWVRNELGTPLVYTYELRGTYFYWPAARIPEQGDEVTQMMLGLVTEANKLGYF